MKKGISFQGYVPIRLEPSHDSEMGSQVLFGETFRILEMKGSWLRLSLDFDGFEGWMENNRIRIFEEADLAGSVHEAGFRMVVLPSITVLDTDRGEQQVLPAGSLWESVEGKTLSIQGRHFELLSQEGVIIPGSGIDPEETGKFLVSIPGIQGGRSGFGFDGPGLVQFLCRVMGIRIPRKCGLQAELGSTINFMHEIRKGDLAFFDNKEGEIDHVGMVLDQGRIIHAYDRVRIDRLDHQGIYCVEREDYIHKLRIIRRINNHPEQ